MGSFITSNWTLLIPILLLETLGYAVYILLKLVAGGYRKNLNRAI